MFCFYPICVVLLRCLNNIFFFVKSLECLYNFSCWSECSLGTVNFRTVNSIFVLIIKPLTDARLYGHRDICRILEVSGGKDFIDDHPMVVKLHLCYDTNWNIKKRNHVLSIIKSYVFIMCLEVWRGKMLYQVRT